MPDHGCRTEPQLSSSFSRSPANIHVVTGLPEFRIKSVDGIQPASAESHVATWNVLCFAIGKEHMGRSARRSSDTTRDRKSTRLNSSHSQISYAVFCLK